MRVFGAPGVRKGVWAFGVAVVAAPALVALFRLGREAPAAPESAPPAPALAQAPERSEPAPSPPVSKRAREPKPTRAEASPPAREEPPLPAEPPGREDPPIGYGPPGSGIALFPPPGTVPPLRGIVVPEEFPLPEGFVRHHQVTDEGEALPAILMFHPDYQWVDAAGEPIAIPADRVVPPELAPPGLPIRLLELPDEGEPDSAP